MLDPERLVRRVQREVRSPENELWLSPISVWEAIVLAGKGRLVLRPDPWKWLAVAFETAPLRDAPLTREVTLQSQRVRLPHRDPADGFLAATAQVYGLTLATGDERLLGVRGLPTLANR